MDGTWQTLLDISPDTGLFFCHINLENMASGDELEIDIGIDEDEDGNYETYRKVEYQDAQEEPIKQIADILVAQSEPIKIEIRQNAGTHKSITATSGVKH